MQAGSSASEPRRRRRAPMAQGSPLPAMFTGRAELRDRRRRPGVLEQGNYVASCGQAQAS